jgi:hypothetical protein
MAQTYSIPERRGMPNWLAAVLIVLFLGVAGYFAYEYGYKGGRGPGVETVALEGPAARPREGGWLRSLFGGNSRNNRPVTDRAGRSRQPRFRSDIPEGVSRSNMSRAIYARKGNIAVRGLADDKPSEPWVITIEFLDAQSWVPREQVNLARTARALTASTRLAEYVQLTAEQKEQLAALQHDAELSAAEKAQFESMMRSWEQSRKDEDRQRTIADQILSAVEEAAARHMPEARQRVGARAAQIGKVLTDEQLRKARQGPPPRDRTAQNPPAPRAPATRPATRPTTLPAVR